MHSTKIVMYVILLRLSVTIALPASTPKKTVAMESKVTTRSRAIHLRRLGLVLSNCPRSARGRAPRGSTFHAIRRTIRSYREETASANTERSTTINKGAIQPSDRWRRNGSHLSRRKAAWKARPREWATPGSQISASWLLTTRGTCYKSGEIQARIRAVPWACLAENGGVQSKVGACVVQSKISAHL